MDLAPKVSLGSASSFALQFIGAGLMYLFPHQPWIGCILIAIGLAPVSYLAFVSIRKPERRWMMEPLVLMTLGALIFVGGSGWLLAKNLINDRSTAPTLAMPSSPSSETAARKSPLVGVEHGTPTATPPPPIGKPPVSKPPKGTAMKVGRDSVVMGRVDPNMSVGDQSVVVGATDENGNTILNTEMAVGFKARAGPGSIAIGSQANAGGERPTPKSTDVPKP